MVCPLPASAQTRLCGIAPAHGTLFSVVLVAGGLGFDCGWSCQPHPSHINPITSPHPAICDANVTVLTPVTRNQVDGADLDGSEVWDRMWAELRDQQVRRI